MALNFWKAVRAVGVVIFLLAASFSAWQSYAEYIKPVEVESIEVDDTLGLRVPQKTYFLFDAVTKVTHEDGSPMANKIDADYIVKTYYPLDIMVVSGVTAIVAHYMLSKKAKKK